MKMNCVLYLIFLIRFCLSPFLDIWGVVAVWTSNALNQSFLLFVTPENMHKLMRLSYVQPDLLSVSRIWFPQVGPRRADDAGWQLPKLSNQWATHQSVWLHAYNSCWFVESQCQFEPDQNWKSESSLGMPDSSNFNILSITHADMWWCDVNTEVIYDFVLVSSY